LTISKVELAAIGTSDMALENAIKEIIKHSI
jgi:hypothetical protein